jgi:hypothetical protein
MRRRERLDEVLVRKKKEGKKLVKQARGRVGCYSRYGSSRSSTER